MKDNQVFFIPASTANTDQQLSHNLVELISASNLFDFISPMDTIALKTHFGEKKDLGYVRPPVIKAIGDLIKKKKAKPFLTETSTLYKGNRSNAIDHIALAHNHGFSYDETGLPLIMLDGLYGDEEVSIEIPGKIFNNVNIAALLERCQGLVLVSHFTGHLLSGFGAALKNLGMGCASRKGKMVQHSTVKPGIDAKNCTLCGDCVSWCPTDAIELGEKSAVIDSKKCIGCGECLAVCRFSAVTYNWGASHEDLQKMVVEHALGVVELMKHNALYINVLTRISYDCDCMGPYKQICPDIGVLVSRDPVALDSASLDLVEEKSSRKFSDMAHNIPYRYQIDYARELQFGNTDYELITV